MFQFLKRFFLFDIKDLKYFRRQRRNPFVYEAEAMCPAKALAATVAGDAK